MVCFGLYKTLGYRILARIAYNSGIGVILLPIMLCHALQLMIVSAIARRKNQSSLNETSR